MVKRQLLLSLFGSLLTCCSMVCWAYEPTPGNANGSVQAIINGTEAGAGGQPWMTALLRKSANATLTPSQLKFCGGSLVAPEWVLTAAHCVVATTIDKMELVIGRDNLDGIGGERRQVKQIIVNPRYDDDTQYADVALLRLALPSTMQPIALATATSDFRGQTGTMLGWGSTSGQNKLPCNLQFVGTAPSNQADYSCKTFVYRALTQSKVLLTGNGSLLGNAACNARFIAALKEQKITAPSSLTDATIIYPGTLCVADTVNRTSTCYGDSGGPLIVQAPGKNLLVGVTSFGIGLSCQAESQLTFFTEVAQHLAFITQSMASEQALSFGSLCPAPVTGLKAVVGPMSSGVASVQLAWSQSTQANGYSLLYVPLPRQQASVGQLELPATQTEFTVKLKSGERYLVSIQAKGSVCDGAVAKPIQVVVP